MSTYDYWNVSTGEGIFESGRFIGGGAMGRKRLGLSAIDSKTAKIMPKCWRQKNERPQ